MGKAQSKNALLHFTTMVQADVPQGRNGKHKLIVTTILNDLDNLQDGAAIKVPLSQLEQSKEKVRSALNRATRKAGRKVATASDDDYLYVWNQSE
jgi:hypothetical protein